MELAGQKGGCLSIMLPQGISGGGFNLFSTWRTFASEISADEAKSRLHASNVAGHGKIGFVVAGSSPASASEAMAVISSFVAVASGKMPEDREVVMLDAESFASALDEGFDPSKATAVADLREQACFDAVTSADFDIVPDDHGLDVYAEYTGKVPDPIAAAFGREAVIDALTYAYFHVLGAEERFDVPEGIDVLKNMSFGRSEMAPGDFSLDIRNSDPYISLIREFAVAESALAESPVYMEYRKLADELGDLSAIWEAAQLESAIGVRIRRRLDRGEPRVEIDVLERSMSKVADLLGIDHMVDAYYGGVPVEHIVNGRPDASR